MVAKHALWLCLILLIGCGGGSETSSPTTPEPTPTPPTTPAPTPTPTPQVTDAQAARLLNQASFGATTASIQQVLSAGSLEAWIDQQLALPASSHQQHLETLEQYVASGDNLNRRERMETWWTMALTAPDQLRQRVAFALSEIFVISEQSNFGDDTYGLVNYYDMLANDAFGNFRDLLQDVTLHPTMGMYLSMLGNEKPDDSRNIRPDENYAREVMQLFTIGLVELNLDGSVKKDANNQPINTYDQDIIKAYAHVYTGWNFNGTTEQTWWRWQQNYNTLLPMTPVEAFHDTAEKQLLNNIVIPAGQTAREDLTIALDSLFNHDNVAPFISKQLIQKLVTSNPSPEYIARVATIFNDNGQGVRGDLGATIKAILLDDEAQNGWQTMPNTFGKVREPLIEASHLWRAFNASSPNNRLQFAWPDYFFSQAPLSAHHVFNFFEPGYAPPGEIIQAGLVAPELQIITETYLTRTSNFMAYSTMWGNTNSENNNNDERIYIDFAEAKGYSQDANALVDFLDLLLCANTLPDVVKQQLVSYYQQDTNDNLDEKISELVYLITTSPFYGVQR